MIERRQSLIRKGYDCRGGRCQHETKGDHGWHGDEWCYVVSDGTCALTLIVYTNDAPETVKSDPSLQRYLREHANELPSGSTFAAHFPWPVSEDSLREGYKGDECEYIDAGRCFGSSAYSAAREFFKKHGAKTFEQPEGFWLAMERELADWRASSEQNAIGRTHRRCMACDGAGIVKLEGGQSK